MNIKIFKLFFCMTFCCLFMTGCVDLNTTLTINKDRSANVEVKALVEKSSFAMAKKQINEVKKSYEKGGSKITNIENGNKIGISAKTYSQNIDKYLISGLPTAFVPKDGNYITIKKGFFEDRYSIDAIVDFSDNKLKSDSYMGFVSDSFFNDGKFNFTLNLPVKSNDSNAGKVTNDGKTLEWTLFYGDKNEIHINFTLINWANIIWTSIAGILLITLSILGIIHRKPIAEKFKNIDLKSVLKKIYLLIAVIVGLCLISFGLYSGYNYYQSKIRNVALYPIHENGKWGYINETGKLVIQPQYDYAETFKNGSARVFQIKNNLSPEDKKDIKQDLYTLEYLDFLSSITKHSSEDMSNIIEERWLSNNNWTYYGQMGYIDKNGDSVDGGLKYGLLPNAINNKSWLYPSENTKFGFSDNQGNTVIYPLFDEVKMFSEGYAAVRVGKKWGYIDEKGKYSATPKFDEAYKFTNGFALYKLKNKYGFINKNGEDITTQNFDDAMSFSEGLAPVSINKKAGYIDKNGKLAINTKSLHTGQFTEGLAPSLKACSKLGYINKKGEYVIKPIFSYFSQSFSDGLAVVATEKGQGVINKKGNYIIQPKFANITKISKLYLVQKDFEHWDDYYYINNKGQEVYHYKLPMTRR